MKISTFLALFVVAIGGLYVFASFPGEYSRTTRRFLVEQLAPVAALIDEKRNLGLYGFGADGKPRSTFDVFASGGGADADFATCLKSAGPDFDKVAVKFFSLSDHKIVANVTLCVVGANRPGLCQEAGRKKLAAIMEIYLWARQRALKLEPDGADDQAAAVDLNDKTWDGPDDRAIFTALKRLAKDGYVSLDDFGWFPRAEIREALKDVEAERTPCMAQASAAKP